VSPSVPLEKFLVVVPNAVLAKTRLLAERIRGKLEAVVFPGPGTVTSSFGIAQSRPGDTWEGRVARADEALYPIGRLHQNLTDPGVRVARFGAFRGARPHSQIRYAEYIQEHPRFL